MIKNIFIALVLSLNSGIIYAQTDTLMEYNKLKAEELKRKLSSLSIDSIGGDGRYETLIPRLVRTEKKIDSLNVKFDYLIKQNQLLLELLTESNSALKKSLISKSTESSISSGYYLVLESQNKKTRALEALDKHSLLVNEKLKLVVSKSNKWYYLVIDRIMTYEEVQKQKHNYRSKRNRDAWHIATEGLNAF